MCIPVGVSWSCGCEWRGWNNCVPFGGCDMHSICNDGRPPPLQLGRDANEADVSYNSIAHEYQLFLRFTYCYGPECCQAKMNAMASHTPHDTGRDFDTVKRHLNKCLSNFCTGHGMVNSMRKDMNELDKSDLAPSGIEDMLTDYNWRRLDLTQLTKYADLCPDHGLQSYDNGDPFNHWMFLRAHALENVPDRLVKLAPDSLHNKFIQLRNNSPDGILFAACVGLDAQEIQMRWDLLRSVMEARWIGLEPIGLAGLSATGMADVMAKGGQPLVRQPVGPDHRWKFSCEASLIISCRRVAMTANGLPALPTRFEGMDLNEAMNVYVNRQNELRPLLNELGAVQKAMTTLEWEPKTEAMLQAALREAMTAVDTKKVPTRKAPSAEGDDTSINTAQYGQGMGGGLGTTGHGGCRGLDTGEGGAHSSGSGKGIGSQSGMSLGMGANRGGANTTRGGIPTTHGRSVRPRGDTVLSASATPISGMGMELAGHPTRVQRSQPRRSDTVDSISSRGSASTASSTTPLLRTRPVGSLPGYDGGH